MHDCLVVQQAFAASYISFANCPHHGEKRLKKIFARRKGMIHKDFS